MKWKLWGMGILFTLILVYVGHEVYAKLKIQHLGEVADEAGIIDLHSLNHMFIVAYPATDIYDTRDKEEVQQYLENFLGMNIRTVRKAKETENHYKLTFEDSKGYRMQLTLYENGTGQISSKFSVIGTTVFIETVDEEFLEHFNPLLLKVN
ncbi:hypothetical protein PB01_13395 [Psychrobacillus glaciei]|uniref:Uncharacterized protein n=1 Tax=Psychrobacillus glaciei TaxID=2283160 RepID=A0A5J6SS94_9BACI|nr:hypothetical protein [Psychrobacillus glaciei]QFF99754.1 hypothetical protein PB01_13395 [Psychrobacillus glaciei]